MCIFVCFFFFFKQKTAYEIKECDWSSDVCSSDLDSIKKARIHGIVLIECTITIDGTIKNCKIIQKLNPIFDQEASRVLKDSPTWIPAKREGGAVEQKRVIPVVFSMQDIHPEK